MTPPAESDEFEVRASWVGLDDEPVLAANQFISQYNEGMFFVSIGQLTPPALLGTEKEQRRQLEELGYVPIRTLGRYALSPSAMAALVRVLQANLKRHEGAEGADS